MKADSFWLISYFELRKIVSSNHPGPVTPSTTDRTSLNWTYIRRSVCRRSTWATRSAKTCFPSPGSPTRRRTTRSWQWTCGAWLSGSSLPSSSSRKRSFCLSEEPWQQHPRFLEILGAWKVLLCRKMWPEFPLAYQNFQPSSFPDSWSWFHVVRLTFRL